MPSAAAERLPEFKVFATDEFRKALARFGPPRFLPGKLETYVYPQLRQGPFFGQNIRKLQGYTPDTWRYRIGPYRLFYCVDEDERIVFMLTVTHGVHAATVAVRSSASSPSARSCAP
jgi:mRNA interferase RelE/StbE